MLTVAVLQAWRVIKSDAVMRLRDLIIHLSYINFIYELLLYFSPRIENLRPDFMKYPNMF